MMHNGSEWYWNLNLHRNQLVPNNPMAVNSKKLPISSAMYTSAVLTDHGICVGMRNVNLKGAFQSYSSKTHDIPNCCKDSNIVSQHNQQTWTAAYDRMRFSALTDPLMATQIDDHRLFGLSHSDAKWNDHVIYPDEEISYDGVSSLFKPKSSIGAEFNPFHLFGDKSVLSSIHFKNGHDVPQSHIVANVRDLNEIHTMNYVPYIDCRYQAETDEKYNCIQWNGHSNSSHSMAESMSSHSNLPSSHSPYEKLEATMKTPYRRINTSSSRPFHVVAPKKKWIRNYMQSNSTYWVSFNFIFGFCIIVHSFFLSIFINLLTH